MTRIFLIRTDWDALELCHSISHDSSDGPLDVRLLQCERVDSERYEHVLLSLETDSEGKFWLDFADLGAGLILVSNDFRTLIESVCKEPENHYQFFEPKVVQLPRTAPKYWWLNLLTSEYVTDKQVKKNFQSWVFNKSLVKDCDYLFRLKNGVAVAATDTVADRFDGSKLSGIRLHEVPTK